MEGFSHRPSQDSRRHTTVPIAVRRLEAYDYGVSGRTFAPDDLTELLGRFRPERAGQKASPEIAEVQIQLLLTRVAALTDALRGAQSNQTTRLASRIVLNDLSAVAGQFRARANTMRPALAKALADLRDARSEALKAV